MKIKKNHNNSVSSHVLYGAFDANGNPLIKYPNADTNGFVSSQCFYYIARYDEVKLDDNSTVLYSIKKTNTPYSPEAIAWWIGEINSLGFKMELVDDKEATHFAIKLKLADYGVRVFMMHGLMLARSVQEDFIYNVPEEYSFLLGKDDSVDVKFEKLQLAHFATSKKYLRANSNHMVTYAGVQNRPTGLEPPDHFKDEPIPYAQYMEKIKKHTEKLGNNRWAAIRYSPGVSQFFNKDHQI